jgi:peptidoglycan/xylan/chitin deacetylase (PgdA/CDA1 family)
MVFIFIMFAGCGVNNSNIPLDSPLLVLTFDDGHSSIYDLAFPLMQKYNFAGVNFIPSGWINKEGHLTLEQLKQMENNGWETGGHSVTHANLTTIPPDSVLWEIKTNYEQLVDSGLKHNCFALPAGHSNSETNKIIIKYFNVIRTSYNERYRKPLDLKRLGYYKVEKNDDAKTLLSRVDHGILEDESIIIFGFHQFSNDKLDYITKFDIDEFEKFLKGVKENSLRTVTLSDAVSKFYK